MVKLLTLAADGSLQEIDVSLSGGSSPNTGTAILDFGTTPCMYAECVVTGQNLISSSSNIKVRILMIDSVDHSADEHFNDDIVINCGDIVAGVGFTVYGKCNTGKTYGKFNVAWEWS